MKSHFLDELNSHEDVQSDEARLNNSLQVWTPHGSSYYNDPGIQADWHSARDLCRSFGGYLVTIRSQETLDFINGFKSVPADQYWIGASDEKKEGTFVWVNDEPWDFEIFPPTEPNGDTVENCLLLFGDSKPAEEKGKFNDMICSDEFRFICERNI
ncbi:C-type lectin domain family 3 member A-like [Mya arenaria]|uniref:C-type lectin domain family 3 member A-like n=1 Tax=Mya arenaria TaxID=6604 RepID=UPI0022E2E848|nr:C-type lectin domain family 3 member A-like [Mya arenaria]